MSTHYVSENNSKGWWITTQVSIVGQRQHFCWVIEWTKYETFSWIIIFCCFVWVFIVTFFTLTGINFQQKVKGSEEFKGLARHWPVWIAPRVVINGWIAAFKIRNVLRFENGPLYAKRQTERENRLCCLNFTTDLFFMLI